MDILHPDHGRIKPECMQRAQNPDATAAEPSAHGNGKAHANGKPAPNGQPNPDAVTPEPSANGNGQATDTPNDFLASRAIRHSELTSGAKLVLEAIADKARHGRSVCTVSYQNLARLVNLKRRRTIDLVGRLARSEWIVVEARRSDLRGFQANHIRMGPRFFKAVEEQVRREEEERKRLPLGQMLDPSAVQCTTLVQSSALPSAVHCTMIRRTPIKDSLKSSSSSTPPRAGDDDDFSLRSQESGGSKQETKLIPDAKGLEMVCRIADRCTHLPGMAARLRDERDLETRIGHDWRGLARQVARLEELVAARDIKFGSIKKPASYVVGMLEKLRSTKLPAGKLDALDATVERLLKSEPQGPQIRHRSRAEPPPHRPEDVGVQIAELELALPELEADVATAHNRTAKQLAARNLKQAREQLAALQASAGGSP